MTSQPTTDEQNDTQRLQDRIAYLLRELEDVGEAGDVCVGAALGRRCRYCKCGERYLG